MGACSSRGIKETSIVAGGPTRRPRRIVVVRHGQSQGNVDATEYARTADWQIELTAKGREQARESGRQLGRMLDSDGPDARKRIFVYCSPYRRCQETLVELLAGAGVQESDLMAHLQEPRLREQDFGNYQDPPRMEELCRQRAKFGRFFFRFPSGESGADVYDRVSTFFETLFREVEYGEIDGETTLLLVTHGLTGRLFLMRWYHWTVAEFEKTTNPSNAQLLVMERVGGPRATSYRLSRESLTAIGIDEQSSQASRRRQTLLSVDAAAPNLTHSSSGKPAGLEQEHPGCEEYKDGDEPSRTQPVSQPASDDDRGAAPPAAAGSHSHRTRGWRLGGAGARAKGRGHEDGGAGGRI